MRTAIIVALSIATTTIVPQTSIAASHDRKYRHDGCHSHACDKRVDKKSKIHQAYKFCNTYRCVKKQWRRYAKPYQGWLAPTRACESGSSGSYNLSTTGNGYWFAYQHTASSWYAAGGKSRNNRPAGMWSMQPTPDEQDYRAVITLHQQGQGAWPICG